jgi:hypothetical protein
VLSPERPHEHPENQQKNKAQEKRSIFERKPAGQFLLGSCRLEQTGQDAYPPESSDPVWHFMN